MLAAYGSGAVQLSKVSRTRILNIDIGGGTTKLSLIRNGEIVKTAAINIGARLLAWDAAGMVTRIEDAGAVLAQAAGIPLWLAAVVWLYGIIVVLIWSMLRYAGDRLWQATVLLFAPRWPMLLPLIVPAADDVFHSTKVAAFVGRHRSTHRLADHGLESEPLPRFSDSTRGDLRVLTLNTHFQALNNDAMRDLILRERPDVIAFQEWYVGNALPIVGHNSDYPYFAADPEAFIASRFPLHMMHASKTDVTPNDGIFYEYQIDFPNRPLLFYNVHLASPHGSLTETLRGEKVGVSRLKNNASARWNEAMHLSDLAEHADDNVMLAGDFNLPADSPVFRNAFSDLADAFAEAGLGYGWTYRTNRTDVRIDHILTRSGWSCQAAWMGPFVGSPHRPLLADFKARPSSER